MKKGEKIIGWIFLIVVLALGKNLLKQPMFFRLVMGLAFGYTLSRAFTGFAGSVNRAYRTGSTKLMRAMAIMFLVSSVISIAYLYNDPTQFGLWVNPINLGLLVGGLLFGFGMSLSSCCATGVFTDLASGLPRALITLVFFGMGVFVGFPIQNTQGWIKNSWFTSPVGEATAKGVFLPDLFKWDGLNGFLGAFILTAVLCGIVIAVSYAYEKKRKLDNTYAMLESEIVQHEIDTFDSKDFNLVSCDTYERIFTKPWTLVQGGVVLSLLYGVLMGVSKSGWGASTPVGHWFGKVLMLFGVSVESIGNFVQGGTAPFTGPFFENAASVQNFGILLGTIFYLLIAGIFTKVFKSELKISLRQGILFAAGGLVMGFGTRLSNGCNVGALYTPIAQFSLAGWIFMIVMVIGAVIGNKIFADMLVGKK